MGMVSPSATSGRLKRWLQSRSRQSWRLENIHITCEKALSMVDGAKMCLHQLADQIRQEVRSESVRKVDNYVSFLVLVVSSLRHC